MSYAVAFKIGRTNPAAHDLRDRLENGHRNRPGAWVVRSMEERGASVHLNAQLTTGVFSSNGPAFVWAQRRTQCQTCGSRATPPLSPTRRDDPERTPS